MTLTLEPLFLQCLYDHPVYVTRYCCHHSRGCWKFKEWSSYSPGRFSFNRLYNVLLHLGLKYNVKPKALMTDQYANFKICFPSMFFLFQHVKFTTDILHVKIINILYMHKFQRPLVKIFWYPKVSVFFFLIWTNRVIWWSTTDCSVGSAPPEWWWPCTHSSETTPVQLMTTLKEL